MLIDFWSSFFGCWGALEVLFMLLFLFMYSFCYWFLLSDFYYLCYCWWDYLCCLIVIKVIEIDEPVILILLVVITITSVINFLIVFRGYSNIIIIITNTLFVPITLIIKPRSSDKYIFASYCSFPLCLINIIYRTSFSALLWQSNYLSVAHSKRRRLPSSAMILESSAISPFITHCDFSQNEKKWNKESKTKAKRKK